MAVGIFVGMTLIVIGLALLSHLSYSEVGHKSLLPTQAEDVKLPQQDADYPKNDCFLPMCYFHLARVRNHETWVVTFLLSGCIVLLLSLA
jgi:hypothetical protein